LFLSLRILVPLAGALAAVVLCTAPAQAADA
jgi:hypothetical protein